MSQLDLKDLMEVLQTLEPLKKPLSLDQALDEQIKNFTFNQPALILNQLQLDINADTEYTVRLFNPQNLSRYPEDTWPLQTQPQAGEAYLEHQLTSAMRVQGDADKMPGLAFNLDGEQKVIINCYRRHESDDKDLLQAIFSDMTPFLLPMVKSHCLEQLKPGEAMGFEIPGHLNADLSVNVTELLMGSVSGIAKGLGNLVQRLSNGVLGLVIDGGFKIDFQMKLKDRFFMLLEKRNEHNYELSIRKALSAERGLQMGLGVEVEFKNKEDVNTLVDATIDKIINQVQANVIAKPKEKIEILIAKSGFNELDEAERALLAELFHRLGVIDEMQSMAEYRNRWQEIQSQIIGAIKMGIQQRLSTGFTYEYYRLSRQTTFLKARLSKEAIDKLHEEIVMFNTNQIIAQARTPESGISIDEYFFEKKDRLRSAMGLSLGLGEWMRAGQKKIKDISQVVTQNKLGQIQVAYEGKREIRTRVGGEEVSVLFDLNAQMPQFSREFRKAGADEFDYSFFLSVEFFDKLFKKNDRKDLIKMLDWAILWKIIPQDSFHEWQERIFNILFRHTDVTFKLSLAIKPELMKIALAQTSNLELGRFNAFLARFLAACLPYSDISNRRQIIQEREETYQPYFFALLNDKEFMKGSYTAKARLDQINLGNILYRDLYKSDRRLAVYERNHAFSMAEYIGRNVHLFTEWKDLYDDFSGLQKAIINQEDHERPFQEAYKSLFSMIGGNVNVNPELGLKVVGRYLMTLMEANHLISEVEKNFVIEYREGNERKSLFITQIN